MRVRGNWTTLLVSSGLVLAGVVAVVQNIAWVRAITADPYSRQRIQVTVSAGLHPPASILATTWGRDFFALGYGQSMGDLPPVQLVDHRADMRSLVQTGRPLYVVSPTFYTLPLKWWDERLGRAHLSAAPGELVRVSDRPVLSETDIPTGSAPVPMGPLTLRGWQVEPVEDGRAWRLALWWQAQERPTRDYSVFVHLSDRPQIDGPGAIVAQADRASPVYGWYPTSRWSAGEIVQDEYLIPVPDGKDARLIAVGLYYQDDKGAFQNLGRAEIPLK